MSDSTRNPQPVADEPTRREWLVRAGELSALAGAAGLVPDLATALVAAQEQTTSVLPPGLYEPATGHLSQALAMQDAPMIPPDTETEYALPRLGTFRPQSLSGAELSVVTRLVALLLGNIDAHTLSEVVEWMDLYLYSAEGVRREARRLSPQQRAVAVAYYDEARVRQLETVDPQTIVRTGLRALEQQARERFNRNFIQAAEAEQASLLREMSASAEASPLRRCYDLLRREAIRGYYTSRAGLRELDYKGNTFHAVCPGCTLRAGG